MSDTFKCSVEAAPLMAALRPICRVVPNRPLVPVIGHAYLKATGTELSITGTNANGQRLALSMDAHGVGDITVPAQRLLAFASALPRGGQVEFSMDGKVFVAKCGMTVHRLPTLPVELFPSLITVDGADLKWTIPSKLLADRISMLSPAAGRDKSCGYLAGICIIRGMRGAMAATNRYVLGEELAPEFQCETEGSFIIPTEAVPTITDLCGMGETVSITLHGENSVSVECGGAKLDTQLLAGEFPPYPRVIPTNFNAIFATTPGEFLATLHRGANVVDALGAPERSHSAVVVAYDGGSLTMSSKGADGEEAKDVCSVDPVMGKPVKFAASFAYLKYAATSLESYDKIEVCVVDEKTPILFRSEASNGSTRLVFPRAF